MRVLAVSLRRGGGALRQPIVLTNGGARLAVYLSGEFSELGAPLSRWLLDASGAVKGLGLSPDQEAQGVDFLAMLEVCPRVA